MKYKCIEFWSLNLHCFVLSPQVSLHWGEMPHKQCWTSFFFPQRPTLLSQMCILELLLDTIIFHFLTYYYGYINSTDPNGMKTYLRKDRSCFLVLLRNNIMTVSCQYTAPQITGVWQRALGGTQVITMALYYSSRKSHC